MPKTKLPTLRTVMKKMVISILDPIHVEILSARSIHGHRLVSLPWTIENQKNVKEVNR